MAVSPTLERELNRTIHHELGHWLVAQHVGFKVGKISVENTHNGMIGSSHIEPYAKRQLTDPKSIAEHIFNRIVVLCAGVAAEIQWKANELGRLLNVRESTRVYDHGVMDETGLNDKGKIHELSYILISLQHPPTDDMSLIAQRASDLFADAFGQAYEILSALQPKLEEMAILLRAQCTPPSKLRCKYPEVIQVEQQAISNLKRKAKVTANV